MSAINQTTDANNQHHHIAHDSRLPTECLLSWYFTFALDFLSINNNLITIQLCEQASRSCENCMNKWTFLRKKMDYNLILHNKVSAIDHAKKYIYAPYLTQQSDWFIHWNWINKQYIVTICLCYIYVWLDDATEFRSHWKLCMRWNFYSVVYFVIISEICRVCTENVRLLIPINDCWPAEMHKTIANMHVEHTHT